MSQQPTFKITKEHFVGAINSLREQYFKDKDYAADIGRIFNSDGSGFYDNSALINSIFSFLHEVFPKDEDGHSEIEHYCYVLNFGRNGEDYESPEQLYDRLMLEKGFLTVNTPEGRLWFDYKNQPKGGIDFLPKQIDEVKKEFEKYPITPEDAFLPNGLDQQITWNNSNEVTKALLEKTGKMSQKELGDYLVKPNPELIDEAGQFPSIKQLEAMKNSGIFKGLKFTKPSPDETA